MSIAATRSHQGDEYQVCVALHWLIRLLSDRNICYIQIDSNGIPESNEKVLIDDVVVAYVDGSKRFIQAKKNHPAFKTWSFSDSEIKEELVKARDQLEQSPSSVVTFYSASPFGDIQQVADGCRQFPNDLVLRRDAGQSLCEKFDKLRKIFDRCDKEVFHLAGRLEFGVTRSFDDWDRDNRANLQHLVARPVEAERVLRTVITNHQAKLRGAALILKRDDIAMAFAKDGLYLTPFRDIGELLEVVRVASRIGREWIRDVGGVRFYRSALGQVLEAIDAKLRTVLITDGPGTGKTCLLLDLADHIEALSDKAVLFIKSDWFSDASTEVDLANQGMPQDIVGICSRLASERHTVVIVDSLDVLSIQRDHKTLQLFLGLLDRLARIPSVTIVAACRSFDVDYHPLLRSRSWDKKVELGLLDEAKDVAPLLHEWGVDSSRLNNELRELLRVPQNLRLFFPLAKIDFTSSIRTTYELLDAFIREIVLGDPLLGSEALRAIQSMAVDLVRRRNKWAPIESFAANGQILHRLISQQILTRPVPQALAFSHQTLLESLVCRDAISKGTRLVDFMRSLPPLPFVRPSVRAYVLHLSVISPERFGAQINAALNDQAIAYHLRRLVAETVAEVDPKADDWLWIREIFRKQPDLFRRVLWNATTSGWFQLLAHQWLPEASMAEPAVWRREFLRRLDTWVNRFPEECIRIWITALHDHWFEQSDLIRLICIQAVGLKEWPAGALAESLLGSLSQQLTEEHDFLGNAISRYVEVTNRGDDLLWGYVIAKVDSTEGYDWERKLRCDEHDFHRKGFFLDRLKRSEVLLHLVVNTVRGWAANQHRRTDGMTSGLLFETTWRLSHHKGDMQHVDALNRLLDDLEQALTHHATTNSEFWRSKEPELRDERDFGIQYILVQAYRAAPATNVVGIVKQLTHVDLLDDSYLHYELSKLLQAASWYLQPTDHEMIQRTILDLHSNQEWEGNEVPMWVWRQKFGYLISIPCIYRTKEAQAFVDRWEPVFGNYLPEPHAFGGGGSVRPPVPHETLFKLGQTGLLRLLDHYRSVDRSTWGGSDHLVGGRDQVESELREAASRDPDRYLPIFYVLLRHGMDAGYLEAVLDGISSYLRYRAGQLNPPQGWQALTEARSDEAVAKELLGIVERHSMVITDGRTYAHCLEGCAHYLRDLASIEQLVFQLLLAATHPDPSDDRLLKRTASGGSVVDSLLTVGINSTRGIAAEAAIATAIAVFEHKLSPPELLVPMLRRFARDRSPAVRATLLRRLPYLTHLNRDVGVRLFDDLLEDPDDVLWRLAELVLYYQYYRHFDWAKPRLARMLAEGGDDCVGAWARLSTLATLAGHMSIEDLFCELEKIDRSDAWAGAALVFASNLDHKQDAGAGNRALLRIMATKRCKEVIGAVDHAFQREASSTFVTDEVALAFIKLDVDHTSGHDWFHFCDWLERVALDDAERGLPLLEAVVSKLEQGQMRYYSLHSKPLISTLTILLRDADQKDDEQLIHRVISVHDRLLKLDVHGMEQMIKNAERF